MSGAKKFNEGKPPVELFSSIALLSLAKVLAMGGIKYGPHNWRSGMEWMKPLGSIGRHWLAMLGGELVDTESGLPHSSHIMAEAMFLTEYQVTHPELNNIYKPSSDTSMNNKPSEPAS